MNENLAIHLIKEYRKIGKRPRIGTIDKINYFVLINGREFESARECKKFLDIVTKAIAQRDSKPKITN